MRSPRRTPMEFAEGGQTVSGESGRVASVFRIGSFRGDTAGLSQDRQLIRHDRGRHGISRGTNPASKVKHGGGAPKSASGDVDDESARAWTRSRGAGSTSDVRLTPTSGRKADMARGPNCANSRHCVYPLRFANGLATSRARSMKSRAVGLSVRFFSVTMPIGSRASGSLTGTTLRSGRLMGNLSREAG